MKTLCFGKAGLIEPENLHAFAVFCQCNTFLCLLLDSLANPRLQLVSCCFSAQHRLGGGRAADSSCVKVDRKVLCSVTCKEAPVCKRWGFWVGFWSEMNMEPYHKWLTMVQSLLWNYDGGQVLDSIVPKINIRGAKQSSISSEKVPILSCLTIVVPTKVKSWGNRRGGGPFDLKLARQNTWKLIERVEVEVLSEVSVLLS